MLPELNLPAFEHRITKTAGALVIFDPIRKKNVALTPEEWVRQNIIRYLTDIKGYPGSRLAVEKQILLNGMQRRCDIVYYNRSGTPEMIVECKAPEIRITQAAFDQTARYNMTLKVPLLVITNGIEHFCCRISWESAGFEFLKEIPECE
ncbi:MAG: type I restriction enzyme HsdR N-terminal domain-containing protein [Bacteroidia bacterium]|nr:type I restriction enzyme HsdR N-terminal domain-containing protein [Bacteroidia bacterium]